MSIVERPTVPMHDTVRRVYEEVRIYSNYYGAIKMATAALTQARDSDKNIKVGSSPSLQLPLHQLGTISKTPVEVMGTSNQLGSCVTGTTSTSKGKGLSATPNVVQGVVMQGGAPDRVRNTSRGIVLNRIQKIHLLLLRADAFSATKQHDKALEDAQAAVQLSGGLFPEAYFIMGQELLRLFRVVDSVNSFEKAELALMSPISSRNLVVEEVTYEDFWAQRGLQMADVEHLKPNRSEMELQEQMVPGISVNELKSAEDYFASSNSLDRVSSDGELGYGTAQLAKWRQLAREARALLMMRKSHVLSINVLQTTLPFLYRRLNSVRNGIVTYVENTTSRVFRLAGWSSPDAAFYAGAHFPDTISPGFCGIALLRPRGWGGFVGSVCYEIADNGMCCFFCFESSFMGSSKCGVCFLSEQRSAELGLSCRGLRGISGSSVGSTPLTELPAFKIPNPNTWAPMHIAPLASGRKLKVWCAAHENNRVITFSVAEVLPIRLRPVELLPALEFAGPAVLKKLSAVNRQYRELVNNLFPPMFYGAGHRSYPDYCLRSDMTISPWVVRDKDPLKWSCVFDSRSVNRDSFVVIDPTSPQKNILLFSSERGGSVEGMVYYGDKHSPLVHIKGSWIPFSNTIYFCTPTGRTFASCYLTHGSQLSLAWDGAGNKSKPEDVEYVMRRKESVRIGESGVRMACTSTTSTTGSCSNVESSSMASFPHTGSVFGNSVAPSEKANRGSIFETYSVWRCVRTSDNDSVSSKSNQLHDGMELVAEVTVHNPFSTLLVKGSPIGEIRLFTGADALLVMLMAYSRFHWES